MQPVVGSKAVIEVGFEMGTSGLIVLHGSGQRLADVCSSGLEVLPVVAGERRLELVVIAVQ
jgi:hypothetical protein